MAHQAADHIEIPSAPTHDVGKPAGTLALLRRVEYLLVAVVLVGFLDTLRFAAYYIPLRFAVNFEEGNQLLAALQITRGLSPYPPVGGPPYIVNPYGPVFYYADAPLVKLFGLSFTAPRLLVLASSFAIALCLILLLKRWTESWLIALGFGLSFLAVPLVRTWTHILRVDLFGIALVFAGLYLFTTGRNLIVPALLFLAAIYTKMTLISAPIACFLFMMLRGDWRRAWRFTGWMMAFGLAGLAALGLGTHGWGLFHMFLTHADQYHVSWYLSRVRPFALLNMALLAGVVVLGVRDFRRRSFSLPFIYAVLATAMTFTIGQSANDANHLLEWQAALCLAAGCGYHSLRASLKPDPVVALIPVGVMMLVGLGLTQSMRLAPALSGCPAAYQFAAKQPGKLLTGNPGMALLAGKKIWLSNSFEYSILGKVGRLDQQPLIQMVKDKSFGLIVLGDDLSTLERQAAHPESAFTIWPQSFVTALAQNYHQVARFSCAYSDVAYKPNPVLPVRTVPTH